MFDVEENYARWSAWHLLEHGAIVKESLPAIWGEYYANISQFSGTKFYFGCGHDDKQKQYKEDPDWDLCDLRDGHGIKWDALMGFPYEDGTLDVVRTKLSLGMFTWAQVRFIVREAARCLKEGGVFEATFRDHNLLLERMRLEGLKPNLYVRYIYGSGLYYGSRRRSAWTVPWLEEVCEAYRLETIQQTERGMNSFVKFERVSGKLRAFSPEPKIKFAEDGSIINDGGEWDIEKRQ